MLCKLKAETGFVPYLAAANPLGCLDFYGKLHLPHMNTEAVAACTRYEGCHFKVKTITPCPIPRDSCKIFFCLSYMPLNVSKGHISVFPECSLLQLEQPTDDLCVPSLELVEQVFLIPGTMELDAERRNVTQRSDVL